MKLPKSTSVRNISIWMPRWHDRTVLIAKFKVGEHNIISFTKAPTYKGKFYLSGKTIQKYPIETNGTIPCYAVSLDELVVYEGRFE